jgi:arylsulfatase A-like enzyme
VLRPLIAGIVTLAVLSVACGGGGGESHRPNILLIITDDQRYGTVADYMPETQKRIFDQGVTFDKAFVTTPLCCPSRASILTGMYDHDIAVHNNPDSLDETTFVQRLQKAGYYTGLVGKYLNSWDFNKPRPEFDYWVSDNPGSSEYYNADINVNGKASKSKYYITQVLKQYALQFIDAAAKQTKPFSLIFAVNAPHEPAIPHIGDETLYTDQPDVSDKPLWLQNTRPLNARQQRENDQLRLRQLQSEKDVDRAIAALLDELEKKQQLDNTVIFFISDNGLFWGEHRLTGKVWPYEEAIHVPMAIRYQKLSPKARKQHTLVANIDLAPTIYDLAGIAKPHEVDGLSLVPLLKGQSINRKDLLIEAWPGAGHYAGVRNERYKYIETDYDLPELYDLEQDPDELENKVNDPAYARVVDGLRARLHTLIGVNTPPPSTLPPLTTPSSGS